MELPPFQPVQGLYLLDAVPDCGRLAAGPALASHDRASVAFVSGAHLVNLAYAAYKE